MKDLDTYLDPSWGLRPVAGGRKAKPPHPSKGAAAGLSKLHNGTEASQKLPSRLTYYPGASLVDIETPLVRDVPSLKQCKKKQKIKDWSASSRSCLKRTLGTLKRDFLGNSLVATLTYPAEFPAPDNYCVYKYHLKKLNTYLKRQWPEASGIWKLEFQNRGAAHYHLMIFGLCKVRLDMVRKWFEKTWYKIAHNGDKNLGKAGTQVDRIKSAVGAINYFAKYMSKEDQTRPGNFTGRYWGKINTAWLPCAKARTMELSDRSALFLRRIAFKKMECDVNKARNRRFLEAVREHPGNFRGSTFLSWQAAISKYQGGAKFVTMWFDEPLDKIDENGSIYVAPAFCAPIRYTREQFRLILGGLKLPRPWKAKNNDRVRLICDATAFVEAIARLNTPASSYLQWSRQ